MGLRLVRSGQSIRASKELADGGQGRILAVAGHSHWVFKAYKTQALRSDPTLEARISTMVDAPPVGAQDRHGHPVLAWPVDLVTDTGHFAGFVMPRIEVQDSVELHEVANPTGSSGQISWDAKAAIAANLVRATAMAHSRSVVIGDFNERNILVWRDSRVTLLDCDSMQISDDRGGTYFCHVGRPEFTAPELLGTNWRTTVRSQSSDLFGLAVHIHQLLLHGEFPFRGVWKGPGEKPPSHMLAADGLWTYGSGRLLQPRPSGPDIDILTPEIIGLFQRAFVDGATKPDLRPTTDEWLTALTRLLADLQTCPRNHSHRYRNGLTDCPWCTQARRKARRGRRLGSGSQPIANVPVIATTKVAASTTARLPAPAQRARGSSGRRGWIWVAALLAAMGGVMLYTLSRSPESGTAFDLHNGGSITVSGEEVGRITSVSGSGSFIDLEYELINPRDAPPPRPCLRAYDLRGSRFDAGDYVSRPVVVNQRNSTVRFPAPVSGEYYFDYGCSLGGDRSSSTPIGEVRTSASDYDSNYRDDSVVVEQFKDGTVTFVAQLSVGTPKPASSCLTNGWDDETPSRVELDYEEVANGWHVYVGRMFFDRVPDNAYLLYGCSTEFPDVSL